jgi:hypothetical protein
VCKKYLIMNTTKFNENAKNGTKIEKYEFRMKE